MMSNDENKTVLIVTIVKKGWGDTVIQASRKAGSKGGTIIFGRGTGVHENKKFMGYLIEPEKEIVLTIAEDKNADEILKFIKEDVGLDKPGCGIGFVIPVDKVFGTAHILCGSDSVCDLFTSDTENQKKE